ncbi:MAG: methylamine utilization protein MauD [Sphingobium sp. 32-64-5]|nr:MAG: methylamine utilization protein MauD [Sphingobium sp. 32-64-5]
MLTMLMISQIISWIVIAMLVIAVLALARQVGVLHVRVAPAGALTTAHGPAVGDNSPVLDLKTLDGNPMKIGGALKSGTLQLLMFVSAQCPMCKSLIPVAKSFAGDERLDLVFVGDDSDDVQRAMIAKHGISEFPFINGSDAGRAYHVEKLPYAVLLDATGTILSKGLVNSREHLESLVVAHEMGVRSVQDYITGLKAEAA